jgi:hypothetical protein
MVGKAIVNQGRVVRASPVIRGVLGGHVRGEARRRKLPTYAGHLRVLRGS